MDLKNITSQSLRRILALTEKKDQLLKGIEEVENQIAKALTGAPSPVAEVSGKAKPAKKGRKSRKGRKSGGLKESILELLESAGNQGLKVKEIAEKLSAKPANIAVWFSTTGKKLVTKVEPGRYAVRGSKAVAVVPVAKAAKKPAKSKKRKSGLTPEGRAKLAANMKARWAARKAGKPAARVGRSAIMKPKAGKNPF